MVCCKSRTRSARRRLPWRCASKVRTPAHGLPSPCAASAPCNSWMHLLWHQVMSRNILLLLGTQPPSSAMWRCTTSTCAFLWRVSEDQVCLRLLWAGGWCYATTFPCFRELGFRVLLEVEWGSDTIFRFSVGDVFVAIAVVELGCEDVEFVEFVSSCSSSLCVWCLGRVWFFRCQFHGHQENDIWEFLTSLCFRWV